MPTMPPTGQPAPSSERQLLHVWHRCKMSANMTNQCLLQQDSKRLASMPNVCYYGQQTACQQVFGIDAKPSKCQLSHVSCNSDGLASMSNVCYCGQLRSFCTGYLPQPPQRVTTPPHHMTSREEHFRSDRTQQRLAPPRATLPPS